MPVSIFNGSLDSTAAPLNNPGTYTGPWVSTEGLANASVGWISAGGATITATIEESFDGVTADRSTSAGAAAANGPATPTVVTLVAPWMRMKLVVSVANATTLRAYLRGRGGA